MRKLFWQINVGLDGFMEGPDHALDYTAGFALQRHGLIDEYRGLVSPVLLWQSNRARRPRGRA